MEHLQSRAFDTWEQTNSALAVLAKAINLMCDRKPSQKEDPALFKVWEAEMRELRQMCGYRRLSTNKTLSKAICQGLSLMSGMPRTMNA